MKANILNSLHFYLLCVHNNPFKYSFKFLFFFFCSISPEYPLCRTVNCAAVSILIVTILYQLQKPLKQMALIILFSIQIQWIMDSVLSKLYLNFIEQEQLEQRHQQMAQQPKSLNMIWWLIDIIYCRAHHQHLRPKYSFFYSYHITNIWNLLNNFNNVHFNNGRQIFVVQMMKMKQFYAHITMRLVFSWWNVYCRPVFRIGCQIVLWPLLTSIIILILIILIVKLCISASSGPSFHHPPPPKPTSNNLGVFAPHSTISFWLTAIMIHNEWENEKNH